MKIESSMLPHRIGKLFSPIYDSLDEEKAYEACKNLLHTVTEIRNVFVLDVNMFDGGNESSGSSHSLAMKSKTHTKFESLTLPMLEAACTKFCETIDSLSTSPSSSNVYEQFRSLSFILHAFREKLAACLSTTNVSCLFIATELCQIEKNFLSTVVDAIADFVAEAEAIDTFKSPAECAFAIQGLQELFNMTLSDIQSVIESVGSKIISSHDASVIDAALRQYEECSSLLKRNLQGQTITTLDLQQGQTIFRSGDIINIIYIVLEGSVVAYDQDNVEMEHFGKDMAFGAVRSPIDIKKHKLGNERMASTIKVSSKTCKLAILDPLQLLRTARPKPPQRRTTSWSMKQRQDARSSWKRVIQFAKIVGPLQSTLKEITIRKSSLLPFLSTGAIEKLAQACREVAVASGETLDASKCWIRIEGRINVIADDGNGDETNSVFEYNKAGQVIRQHTSETITFTALQDSRLLQIPQTTLKTLLKGPLKKQAYAFTTLGTFLCQDDYFEQMSPQGRQALLGEFRQVKIRAQDVLFEDEQEGDSVYIVSSGCLCVVSDDDDDDASGDTQELRDGQGVGLDSLLRPGVCKSTCVAQETTVCWVLRHDSLDVAGLALE